MSKKKAGMLIAFGAALGAAAAGISYYLKYKSFNDEVEQDFHDYEDDEELFDEEENTDVSFSEPADRTYITLDSAKTKEENVETPTVSEDSREKAEEAKVITEETEMVSETEETPTVSETRVEEDIEGTDK